jgi:hypothetical protein
LTCKQRCWNDERTSLNDGRLKEVSAADHPAKLS